MRGLGSKSGRFLSSLAVLGLAITATTVVFAPADARGRHRHHHFHRHASHHRIDASAYSAAFAAMVVDANTGRTLYAVNENELRHPASITKVMTLYLLFEQLEKGKITLDTEIPVSAHAASMSPTKLGLRAGSEIRVEDAIKAIVTKSANDMAVTIAEAIGGTESHFAELMTAKARELGMTRTNYANASGLPDPDQITTAHDLVVLGRAVQERFPRYYAFFSTHEFTYHGQTMRNHNHMLDHVEGMDGIKTGYTNASGFNILTSVKRNGRRIVSVVMGGRSVASRDKIMAGLIDDNLGNASNTRVANAAVDDAPDERVETAKAEATEGREPIAPQPRIEAAKPAPVTQVAVAKPVVEKPRPAVIANAARSSADDRTASIPERKTISYDGSTRAVAAGVATSGPRGMHWISGPTGAPVRATAEKAAAQPRQETRLAKLERDAPTPAKAESARPSAARSGIMIQIGATDEAGKANDLLARAKTHNPALAGATPFTEKVQKGSETLWRARFAGLTETQADSACKTLKRGGFACFATKN